MLSISPFPWADFRQQRYQGPSPLSLEPNGTRLIFAALPILSRFDPALLPGRDEAAAMLFSCQALDSGRQLLTLQIDALPIKLILTLWSMLVERNEDGECVFDGRPANSGTPKFRRLTWRNKTPRSSHEVRSPHFELSIQGRSLPAAWKRTTGSKPPCSWGKLQEHIFASALSVSRSAGQHYGEMLF
jgi:hypothetical protein